MSPLARYALTFSLLCSVQCARDPQSSGPNDPPAKASALLVSAQVLELADFIENVVAADGYVYNAHDSAGHSMDTAKIIADP